MTMGVSVAVAASVNLAFGVSFGPIALVVSLSVPLFLTPAIGMVHISLIIELHEAEARAIESAAVDSLTNLPNRQAFADRAASALSLCARNDFEISLIYLDLDNFKRINDTFGHGTGDRVLKQFATLLKASMRRTDIIARVGGEEFAVALVNATVKDASRLAEKVRREVESAEFRSDDGLPIGVTVSAGVTSSEPSPCLSLDELVSRADRSLYEAKKSGRNRVRIYDPEYAGERPKKPDRSYFVLGTAVNPVILHRDADGATPPLGVDGKAV